jgi:single-stranded DNA-binding protein
MAAIKTQFEGKIGKQPILNGEGDKAWTSFSVATDKYVGEGKGDMRPGSDQPTAYHTTWVNCVSFGRQAQYICDRFAVGDTIVVLEAELEMKNYEKKDKESGNIIDSQALGVRAICRDVTGPYRVAPKTGNGQQSNGNGQQSSNGNGNGNSNGNSRQAPAQQASRPAAQTQQRSAPAQRSAPVQSQAATMVDDDIPF